MKKILFLTIVLPVIATATHNRAAEITYKRIAPFTNGSGGQVYTYSITVTRYTDHGISVAERCADTVEFGDGSRAAVMRSNGSSTCSCPSCGDLVINTSSLKVKKSIYSVVHTYAGPGTYLIRSRDPNRNPGVVNISNSVAFPFYVESLLTITSTASNDSPVMSNIPVQVGYNTLCFYHSPGATDPDGDSLSYLLVPCMSDPGQSIAGFSNPATGPNGYYFQTQQGQIQWCMPATVGEYNIAMKIMEWRKPGRTV